MRTERVLGTAALRLVGVLMLAAAVVAVVAPLQPNLGYDVGTVRLALTVLLIALLGFGKLARPKRASRWLRSRRLPAAVRRHPLAAAVGVTVVGSVGCTIIALNEVYQVGWDASIVSGIARAVAEHRPLDAFSYSYLSKYPNNIPLLLVDEVCQHISRLLGWEPAAVFVVLNGGCLAITVQSVYVVVRVLRSASSALVAQLLTLVLLGLSP